MDLTLLTSTAYSNYGSAALATGHLAELRERRKAKKYEWQTDILNFAFIGAAMEDGGACGTGLKGLIDHLCRHGANPQDHRLNWSVPSLKALVFQKLSMAVQRGFAQQVEVVAKAARAHAAKSVCPQMYKAQASMVSQDRAPQGG